MDFPVEPPIYQSGNLSAQAHLDWVRGTILHFVKALHFWMANVYAPAGGVLAYGDSLPATDSLITKAESTPSMKIKVLTGMAVIDGALFFLEDFFTSETLAAPTLNPRIDLVYAKLSTQQIHIATGVENASPMPPTIPDGAIAVANIHHTVAETVIKDADDSINGYIEDVRTYANM